MLSPYLLPHRKSLPLLPALLYASIGLQPAAAQIIRKRKIAGQNKSNAAMHRMCGMWFDPHRFPIYF